MKHQSFLMTQPTSNSSFIYRSGTVHRWSASYPGTNACVPSILHWLPSPLWWLPFPNLPLCPPWTLRVFLGVENWKGRGCFRDRMNGVPRKGPERTMARKIRPWHALFLFDGSGELSITARRWWWWWPGRALFNIYLRKYVFTILYVHVIL